MLGKTFIIIGLVIVAAGIIVTIAPRVPFLGRLPGDIYYKKDNFVFYFPVATSILISVIASLVLYFLTRR
ncbi:MAG: DUF2905 domain-containing protein [Deltaproteobacteria bacterium]|nr:DUF2905 domain-containing protein [Deltaproteobacteria bacterium]